VRKRLIGQPEKFRAILKSHQKKKQKSDEEQRKADKSHVHKCGTYVNYFQQDLWPPIIA
jgi:hypothetical protein